MSIFHIGGPKRIVPKDEIKQEMYEDRYFLPGDIHGGDYLIRIYLNDAVAEDDPDEFITEYITAELIKEAYAKDPEGGDVFNSVTYEGAENFACYNDGSGDFASLIEEWPHAIVMSNSDLVDWANSK